MNIQYFLLHWSTHVSLSEKRTDGGSSGCIDGCSSCQSRIAIYRHADNRVDLAAVNSVFILRDHKLLYCICLCIGCRSPDVFKSNYSSTINCELFSSRNFRAEIRAEFTEREREQVYNCNFLYFFLIQIDRIVHVCQCLICPLEMPFFSNEFIAVCQSG